MADSLEGLDRAQLQSRAKALGVPANLKSDTIVRELRKPAGERRLTKNAQHAKRKVAGDDAKRIAPPAPNGENQLSTSPRKQRLSRIPHSSAAGRDP